MTGIYRTHLTRSPAEANHYPAACSTAQQLEPRVLLRRRRRGQGGSYLETRGY